MQKPKRMSPLCVVGHRLLELGCTDADLTRLESEAERYHSDALQFAESSPLPEPADAFTDVFI
jgi:TPP-dependent pyruvate/acetoin dehydrogenase alpha subunit